MMEPPPPPQQFCLEKHEFVKPKKVVKTLTGMSSWKASKAYSEYVGFILNMNNAVAGKSLTANFHLSEQVIKLVELIDSLFKIIDECPPIKQPSRFGNKAFKTWFDKLKEQSSDLLQIALPEKFHVAIPEIKVYLEESFGNVTRIDYGTGHELSFLMFLCCLFKIGVLTENDRVATVNRIFYRYLELVRSLQHTYKMEPAGSHGVWSLDDFQFMPFVWGSSQLSGHTTIEPHLFLDENILENHGDKYMYLSCIKYIQVVKTGPFAEHSNQLWNISAIQSWKKINSGLLKMYSKEILDKFPVVQHIMFGSLLSYEPYIST